MLSRDSFGTRQELIVGDRSYVIHSLPALASRLGAAVDRLPFSLKVLLENLLRHEDGVTVTTAEIEALATWAGQPYSEREVAFYPTRVLMPDSSGIPLLVDLAAMRDAVAAKGLDPRRVNPLIHTDLVIDHSVAVDYSGSPQAYTQNLEAELRKNKERYGIVRWASTQYDNLRVIPPANGILHQINLEYLATVVATKEIDGETLAFPDSLVGMDSHTPMINGLAVFGWGVGGIEAATAQLGQPVSMLIPEVVGCRVVGKRRPGVVCTDIVLTLTQLVRRHDVLGAVVEFFGEGVDHLSLPDRATLANMAPEYGATMGFFPIDAETVRYLSQSGRPVERIALVEAYARAQGMFRVSSQPAPEFGRIIEFDLATVEPALAGPSRPEDRVPLAAVPANFQRSFADRIGNSVAAPVTETERALNHGDVMFAAISSCTNTSNPAQMIAAGLLARNAVARGLSGKAWVKRSLSPGSRVVSGMLGAAGLLEPLAQLGFHVVGYGCMTCGGGAGPLPDAIVDEIAQRQLVALGVISSNRNFEGRLHPSIRGTYLASPPLVVAYGIVGSIRHDLTHEPLGMDDSGKPVYLADIWPSDEEVRATVTETLTPDLFRERYENMADGGPGWMALQSGKTPTFDWDPDSLYLKLPPFATVADPGFPVTGDILGARALLILGDNVTTDHISPGGAIPKDNAAGRYLMEHGVEPARFHTYVARRANHEVMVRGTFANIRIKNQLVAGKEGGWTRHMPDGAVMTVFDAAVAYRNDNVPLVVIGGRNYGCGSSRDWAAKGTRMLGIRAVIAESFERIHRSNLVGMGVVPLQFPPGVNAASLALDGSETIDLLMSTPQPRTNVVASIHRSDGSSVSVDLRCRVDTQREADWVRHGGILPYVLHEIVDSAVVA